MSYAEIVTLGQSTDLLMTFSLPDILHHRHIGDLCASYRQ